MDSAHDEGLASWPSDASAAAAFPLSPADSASELPDPPSTWCKPRGASRVLSNQPRKHSHQSHAEVCSRSDSAAEHSCEVASRDPTQHVAAVVAALQRRRLRAAESLCGSAGPSLKTLRSHPLLDLDPEGSTSSRVDARQTPQQAAAHALPSVPPSPAAHSSDSKRLPAMTAATATMNTYVIPSACRGAEVSQLCHAQPISAAQSLGCDGPCGCPSSVAAVLGDDHLLAFGALIGEAASATAMATRGGASAVGDGVGCMFGAPDNPAARGSSSCRCSTRSCSELD